jgi:threonine dehydratase
MNNILTEIQHAEQRIRPYVRETYLQYSPAWSEQTGCQLYFKLENLQHTGSFKLRGAFNKILSLSGEEQKRGVVTASTGNHGAATAYALKTLGVNGLIFVPENASPTKVSAIRALGGNIQQYGTDGVETERFAREYADKHGQLYISPYNDPQIVGGQGTIGVEIARQLADVDAVFVALGGGGLMSGIAVYLKSFNPNIKIVACSPKNSQVMAESVQAGEILDLESLPTLSDGTAGGVEVGSITFPLCQQYVDEYVSVTEDEIAGAMGRFMETEHMLLEGAGGVACAGILQTQQQYQNQKVAIIICGANISLPTLQQALTMAK